MWRVPVTFSTKLRLQKYCTIRELAPLWKSRPVACCEYSRFFTLVSSPPKTKKIKGPQSSFVWTNDWKKLASFRQAYCCYSRDHVTSIFRKTTPDSKSDLWFLNMKYYSSIFPHFFSNITFRYLHRGIWFPYTPRISYFLCTWMLSCGEF